MTQAAGPPATEGPSQDAPSTQSADAPTPRITPALWMPVGPALTWLAIGSAEDVTSPRLYLGAVAWPLLTPAEVAEWLDDVAQYGDAEPRSPVESTLNLAPAIYRRAQAISSQAVADETSIRAAAAEFRQRLLDALPEATEQHRQLWQAAERLRLAIAKEEIKAYGWPGEWPSEDEPRSTDRARSQIPASVCAAPVTLTHLGLLPFIKGDPIKDGWSTLWHGIRISAHDLLTLRPAPDDAAQSIAFEPAKAEAATRSKGGRPPHPLFKPFVKEMIRLADADGLVNQFTSERFVARMHDHLAQHFKGQEPSTSTIRGWVNELWPWEEQQPDKA